MTPGRTLYVDITRRMTLRRSDRYGWKATTANGKSVAISGEGYANRAHAKEMAHKQYDNHPFYTNVIWR